MANRKNAHISWGILGLILLFFVGKGIWGIAHNAGRINSKANTDMEDNIQLDETKVARFLTILQDNRPC